MKKQTRVHRHRRNQTMRKKQQQQQHMQGGRRLIAHPKIKYNDSNSDGHNLSCTKCQGRNFVVKTMTLGTKIKSFLGFGILDNRFKIFTCTCFVFVHMFRYNF